MVISVVVGGLGTIPKSSDKGPEELKISGVNKNHPDYNIGDIGLNTQTSS